MTKDVAKIKTDIGDLGFEVSAAKDLVKKSDKLIETNHKELKTQIGDNKKMSTKNEEYILGLKKNLQALDDRLKNMIKNAALSGNSAMGESNIVQEIEDKLGSMKDELDEFRKHMGSEQRILRNDLFNKATKDDTQLLETNMMDRIQEMLDALKDSMPDKENLGKRFRGIEKQVSSISLQFVTI